MSYTRYIRLPHYQVFKELFLREQSLKTKQNLNQLVKTAKL